MTPRRVLVTGGAGFVGSALALRARAAWPDAHVIAFDNLRRRGSELNLARLRDAGVAFVHGDIRNPADLAPLGRDLDLLLECSAEPSVLAGYDGDPSYVIDTNLGGTVHCLELARRAGAAVVFLSTSRVYPIAALNAIATTEAATRFEIAAQQVLPGVSAAGIGEDFPLQRRTLDLRRDQARLGVAHRRVSRGIRAAHDRQPVRRHRRSVADGQGRSGRVLALDGPAPPGRHAHLQRLGRPGQTGQGSLARRRPGRSRGHPGGAWTPRRQDVQRRRRAGCSLSLRRDDRALRSDHRRRIAITPKPETRVADIKLYVTDNTRVTAATGWAPRATPAGRARPARLDGRAR